MVSPKEALALSPNLKRDRLRGGATYSDGQFDDARLALALVRTAAREGARVLNHAAVTALPLTEGTIQSATINAAEALGRKDIGVIEAGRHADIVAVKGDPAKDVTLLEQIDFVMKGGEIVKQP